MTRRQFHRSLLFASCVLLSVGTPVWMGYHECWRHATHSLQPSECASSPVYTNASQYWSVLAEEAKSTLIASVNGPAQECFPPECVDVTSCSITLAGCYTVELKVKDKAWQFVPVTVAILPKHVALVGSTVELVCQPGFDSTDPLLQQQEPARWERNGEILQQDQYHKDGHVEILNVSHVDSGKYVCVLPGFRSQPVTLQVRIARKVLHEETLKAVTGVLIFFAILIVGGTIILCMRCRKPKPAAPLTLLFDVETLENVEPVTVTDPNKA